MTESQNKNGEKMDLNILYEDKYILCLEKPQGIPSQSDKTNDPDLMTEAIEYLKKKEANPYIGLIHRLDRPVGGVIVFAKTEYANKELSKQVQQRETKKEYMAVVCGKPEDNKGVLEDYLKKLKTINMSKVTTPDDKQAKLAKLEYEVLDSVVTDEYGALTLLKIILHTGRHHQIRAQLSNAGMPIWGDNKYNRVFMKKKEFTQIALWSYKFGFKHPKTKEYKEFTKDVPDTYPFNIFNIK
jgi:23S rRNA pseudouridine1911/1915/1917 synthase